MKKQIIPIAVIAVVLLAGLALWLGLREKPESTPGEVAQGITIFAPQNTEVIVFSADGEEGTESEKFQVPASGKYTLELEPGDYTILANRGDQYYPWKKDIVVTTETSTEFYPILFPQEPERELIDSTHADFAEVSAAFAVPATLPTATNPKENKDGTAEVYVDGNTIFIGWMGDLALQPEFLCPGENVEECRLQPIFTFDAGTVENIEFFGEYEEVLILDRGAVIMALEIDRRDTRNQQPIYLGTNAAFRIIDGNIYVSDNGVISRIVLD